MNYKLMNSFVKNTFIPNLLNLRWFLNYIPLITYVILAVFISLFIVNLTTIPDCYNLYWFGRFTRKLRITLFILGLISCYSESKMKLIICFCYYILSYETYKHGHSWVLFDLFFVPLFLSKKLNLSIVINIFFYLILIGTIVTITLDLFDFLPKFPSGFFKEHQIRYNLGFSHPNSLGLMFMLISMLLVLKVKKMNFWCVLVLAILCSLCVILPKSYSSTTIIFFLTLFSVCKIIFQNFSFDVSRRIIYFFAFGVLACVIIGTYVAAFTDVLKDLLTNLPQSLSGRFVFGAKAFYQFGFSVFGQEYNPVGTGAILKGADPSTYFVVDCLYFFLPVFVGIVPSLVYLFLFCRGVWFSVNRGNYALLFILIMISVYSVSEYLVIFPLFMFAYFDYNAKISVSQN